MVLGNGTKYELTWLRCQGVHFFSWTPEISSLKYSERKRAECKH